MTNYQNFTKAQILDVAKSYGVVGRHEKSKETLIEICTAHASMLENAQKVYSKENLKNITRRLPSLKPRDENGRVIRAGRNLSGNTPFARKWYFLDAKVADPSTWTAEYKEAFSAAPKQVRGILEYMAFAEITKKVASNTGPEICEAAKDNNFVKSVIPGALLFAYYRRAMETLGLIFAGSFTEEDAEEGLAEDEVSEDEGEETEE